MRKHFLILMLMALLPLTAWSTARDYTYGPADGTAVGATVQIQTSAGARPGLVTYRVTDWDATNDFYKVKITGLDADGIAALEALTPGETFSLEIPVSFREKFGENYYNYAVTEIVDGLNGAEPQAFYGFTMIESLTFVNPNVSGTSAPAVAVDKFYYTVGQLAFYGCTSMETLTFTENCKSIGAYAFQNTAISNFEIPKKCDTINGYAFYNCQNLNNVTVASGNNALTKLDDYVFANSSLKNLDLTNASALTTIGTVGNSPFLYNLSIVNDVLKTVKLPASVRDINDSFAKCTALTNIYNLENTVLGTPTTGTHIMNGAFNGCRSLTRLDIPNCDVYGSPFVGCIALDTLTFVALYNHEIYKTAIANQNLYGVNDPTMAGYVAADQAALKVVEFKGVLNGDIHDNAFVGMTALAKVDFQGMLRSDATIGAAFTDVTSLTEVVFNGIHSDGVADVTIKANAFKNTGIAALNFNGIQLSSGNNKDFIIENNAFSDCANLADIQFGTINVGNTGKINIGVVSQPGAFINNPALAKVTFGATSFTANGRINIYDGAFAAGNVALTEVEFGNITSSTGKTGTLIIGADANTDLATPVLASDVENLTFGDGAHLQKVTFGNLTTGAIISAGSFASTGLTDVTFGNITAANLSESTGFIIGKNAFLGGNTADKTVVIGNIADNTNAGATLSFNVLENAFAAKMLKSVQVGAMSATMVQFFENSFANATKADYDTDNETLLATQNLQSVTLGNITAGKAASLVQIKEGAFWGGKAANKTVVIGTINDNNVDSKALTVNINKNAFAAEKLYSVQIGDMAATAINIDENAFANMKQGATVPTTQNLQSVTLGNITASNVADAALTVKAAAFWGGNVDDKVVTIGTIKDKASTTKHTTTVVVGDDAFAAQSLKTVTIGANGMSATKIEFGENAFANATKAELAAAAPASQNLQTVALGNITAGNAASTFEAKKGAFWGGNVAAKSVTVGTITDATPATLTATFGDQVAQAEKLQSVVIDDMTATSLTIGTSAFSGKDLTTVQLGDMTATTLAVGASAFANVNTEDALAETITIGEIGAGLTITTPDAFKGPQGEGSALNVTIDEISGAATIPASTFVAPAKGTSSYVVEGDLAASTTTNIAAGAFVGSQNSTLTKNTTTVKFQGDYNEDFKAGTFTNVDSVEIAVAADGSAKEINAATGRIGAFAGARIVTVGNIPTGKQVIGNVAGANDIEEVKFVGSVLGNIRSFTSPKVRKINFANVGTSGVKVVAKAVKAYAFANAADAAKAANENISVIYQEAQTTEAKNIFDGMAFVQSGTTAEDGKYVTLYTTTWAKANIYESQNPVLNWNVYRLAFSASDVVPGEPITVKVGKRDADTYAYGKLYLPKGSNMKYKLDAEVTGTGTDAVNNVQLYYARIDKSKNAIYMHSLPTIDGYYWIDATEVDQAFMVRTKGKDHGTVITAEPVTAEENALFAADTNGDYVYFDKNFAKLNQFGYNTEKIANQNLRNDAEFFDRNIYYLANPRNRGFAFIQVNKDTDDLAAKSLYIVGKLNTVNGHATVIFDDEEGNESETTGIENVNAESNNGAIYNLQGVRVNGAVKGMFIQNGKKYVVK